MVVNNGPFPVVLSSFDRFRGDDTRTLDLMDDATVMPVLGPSQSVMSSETVQVDLCSKGTDGFETRVEARAESTVDPDHTCLGVAEHALIAPDLTD